MTTQASSASFHEFARRSLFVLGIVILVLLAWQLRSVLLLIFAGALFATVLRTLAAPVVRFTPLDSAAAVGLVLIVIIGLIGGTGLLIGGQISAQLGELWSRLPEFARGAEHFLAQTDIGRTLLELAQSASAATAATALSAAAITFSVITDILLILFLGLFFAASPNLYLAGTVALVPPAQRDRASEVLLATGRALQNWILAQFAAMVVIGLVTWLGLSLLGVPLALGLAFIAFLLEFVPVVGPIVAAIPAMLVGLSISPMMALWVALLYLVIQQLDSYALMPLLQRWAVHVPPALTLMAIVSFGLLFGWMGVFLATPLMVATIVLVRKAYVELMEDQPAAKILKESRRHLERAGA